MHEHHDPLVGRRGFVRLVGGGVIVAAGGLGAGCSRQLPPEAIEAWKGPSPTEPDVRRWILAHAILAPHSHNLQSWLVDLRTPGEMLLRCDLERLLPATDPFSRQIMMSHGTFIELLDIAARERGQRAEVALFPEGVFGPDKIDQRPVARIRLVPDAAVAKDALFAQILRRHTNRNAYDLARPVPAEAWAAMAQAVKPHALRFGFVGADQPEALQRHRAIAAQAWRDRAHHAGGDSRELQGVARRCSRSGQTPRRLDADGPDGGVARSPGPVRSQQGPGARRLCHHQPDQGLQRQDRVDTRLPVDGERRQRPRHASQRRARLRARAARRHGARRGDAAAAAGAAGVP